MLTKARLVRGPITFVFLLACSALPACAQGTIFLVRHAEKVSDADDALLSPAGHARAECLAGVLADANITKIYATDVKRTQQTAGPLAGKLHLQTTIVKKKDFDALVRDLTNGDGQNVLIVGHSDTLPKIIEQLGAGQIQLASSDYDRLFIVNLPRTGKPKLITLHYCTSK